MVEGGHPEQHPARNVVPELAGHQIGERELGRLVAWPAGSQWIGRQELGAKQCVQAAAQTFVGPYTYNDATSSFDSFLAEAP